MKRREGEKVRRWGVALVAMAALPLIAAPAREQRNYRDTTWWDPPVTNITDADTYLRRKFRQDVTDKSTGLGQQELLRRLEDIVAAGKASGESWRVTKAKLFAAEAMETLSMPSFCARPAALTPLMITPIEPVSVVGRAMMRSAAAET